MNIKDKETKIAIANTVQAICRLPGTRCLVNEGLYPSTEIDKLQDSLKISINQLGGKKEFLKGARQIGAGFAQPPKKRPGSIDSSITDFLDSLK